MADSNLLSMPQPQTENGPYLPIANECIALPAVRPNGRIDGINVPSRKVRDLLEFKGNPLISS